MHALTITAIAGDPIRHQAAEDSTGGMSRTVGEWLDGANGGDQQAAERLVAHLYPSVMKILRGRLPKHLSEEDVAQDVFVKMFAKLKQYRREVPLEHWVSRIAVTVCLNAVRGKRHRLELRRADLSDREEAALDNRVDPDDACRAPDAQIASKELLTKLLSHLSPKDRLIIEMIELEGRTSKEVAAVLGITSIALRVRATRARAKLRSYLTILLKEPQS